MDPSASLTQACSRLLENHPGEQMSLIASVPATTHGPRPREASQLTEPGAAAPTSSDLDADRVKGAAIPVHFIRELTDCRLLVAQPIRSRVH